MKIYLNKKIWTKDEWEIYFNNLDLLREAHGLKKKELNSIIGMGNLYRKDVNRPRKSTIVSICQKFNITEEWFANKNTKYTSKKGLNIKEDENVISFDPAHRITEAFLKKSGIQLDDEGKAKLIKFFRKRYQGKLEKLEQEVLSEVGADIVELLK